jgi:hypothetical protein
MFKALGSGYGTVGECTIQKSVGTISVCFTQLCKHGIPRLAMWMRTDIQHRKQVSNLLYFCFVLSTLNCMGIIP